MAEKKLTSTEVLSFLDRFATEWSQFRNLWDQLTPSFAHIKEVVTRFGEISTEIPLLERQYKEWSEAVANIKSDLAAGRKSIETQLAKYREQMEHELVPLKNELEDTREKIFAIQRARTEAEHSFEERKRVQEVDLREIEDRMIETQRKLDEIGRLTGAVHGR
jgi:chromosome segregation ATPase